MTLKRLWHNVTHPITALDNWWFRNSPDRRLDRNFGNICMLIGLMFPTLAIVLVGPVPNSQLALMPNWLQIWMCAFIFFGCGTKLHGAMSGSRWYFPKIGVKKAYSYGFIGAPFATTGLLIYGYFILTNTQTWVSALGGILTPMLGIGIGLQAIQYWLEWRRIDRNEAKMISIAKKKVSNDSDTLD